MSRRLTGEPPQAVAPGLAHIPRGRMDMLWDPSKVPRPSSDQDLGQDIIVDCMNRGSGGGGGGGGGSSPLSHL